MDDNNFAIVLESYVIISSLQVAQVNKKKASVLDHFDLATKWVISLEKALNMIWHPHSMASAQCYIHPYNSGLGQMIVT